MTTRRCILPSWSWKRKYGGPITSLCAIFYDKKALEASPDVSNGKDIPKPRSTRYNFFSLGVPGWPSKKFSGLTSPCTNLEWKTSHYEHN